MIANANRIDRSFERFDVFSRCNWDFFSTGHGSRPGVITNISRGGCLLRTNELIEHRRWIRVIATGRGNVHVALIGRVTRCENSVEATGDGEVTLYRYGIEFTPPGVEAGRALACDPDQLFAPAPLDNVTQLAQPLRGVRSLIDREEREFEPLIS